MARSEVFGTHFFHGAENTDKLVIQLQIWTLGEPPGTSCGEVAKLRERGYRERGSSVDSSLDPNMPVQD